MFVESARFAWKRCYIMAWLTLQAREPIAGLHLNPSPTTYQLHDSGKGHPSGPQGFFFSFIS